MTQSSMPMLRTATRTRRLPPRSVKWVGTSNTVTCERLRLCYWSGAGLGYCYCDQQTKPLEGVTIHLEYVGNKKLLMVMKLTWHAGTRNWSIKAARNSELQTTMTQLGVTLYLEYNGGQNLRAPADHDPARCNFSPGEYRRPEPKSS
jgi:hypothetical protein